MKIIFSPAKTFNFEKSAQDFPTSDYNFDSLYKDIVNEFKSLSKEELKLKLNLSDKLIESVYDYYHNFSKVKIPAILMYNGVAFKELELNSYTTKQLNWLQNNVVILDAFYGLIKPFDLISPYRLDYTIKINIDNKNYYKDKINALLAAEDEIINLASKEFSSLIVHNDMKTPNFNEKKSSIIKKLRGSKLNELIKKVK